jgi:hypothetical protein
MGQGEAPQEVLKFGVVVVHHVAIMECSKLQLMAAKPSDEPKIIHGGMQKTGA